MAETCEKTLAGPADNEADDDKLLVEQFGQGDDSAFDRIVERYLTDISTLASRLLAWPGEVEDVVQNVLLAAFLGLKKFRCQCGLRTWLFTITINKCRTHRYKRMLHGRLFSKAFDKEAPDGRPVADKMLIDRETFERVRRAVRALPQRYREPVVLRYLQELSTEQIVEILGISKNVLQVRLNRARNRLKQDLAELIEE